MTQEERRIWYREYNKTPQRKEYLRKWRQNRKENVSIHLDRYSWNKKVKMLETVADGKEVRCVKCGIKDKRILQVHHINGDGSRSPTFYRETVRKIKLNNSKELWPISELEIRCCNCNILAEYEELGRRYVSASSFDEDGNPTWKETPFQRPSVKEHTCEVCGIVYKPRSNRPRKHRFCSMLCFLEWKNGNKV